MRFPFLDLVRAGACLWVAVAHLTLITGHPVFIVSQGNLAVDVFILTSGFLMCLVLSAETHLSVRSVWAFYVRRWFRIAPAFYLALLLYGWGSHAYREGLQGAEAYFQTPFREQWGDPNLSWETYLLHLTFLHGLFPQSALAVFGPAWTLSLEMQFYGAAPFFVWYLRRFPVQIMLLSFAMNLAANYCFGLYGGARLLDYRYPSFLPSRIFLFGIGAVACLYLQTKQPRVGILLLAACGGEFWLFGFKSGPVVGAVVILLALSVSERVPVLRILLQRLSGLRLVAHLAEYSYGIYLFHLLVMGLGFLLVARFVPLPHATPTAALLYLLLVLLASIALSAAVFRWLENPCRSLGRKISLRASRERRVTKTPVADAVLPR